MSGCGCAATPPPPMSGGKKATKKAPSKPKRGGAIATRSKCFSAKDTFSKSIGQLIQDKQYLEKSYETEIPKLIDEVYDNYEAFTGVEGLKQAFDDYELLVEVEPKNMLNMSNSGQKYGLAKILGGVSLAQDLPESVSSVPLTMTKLVITLAHKTNPAMQKSFDLDCYKFALNFANENSKVNYETAFKIFMMAVKANSVQAKDALAHFIIILSTLAKATFPKIKNMQKPSSNVAMDDLADLFGSLLGSSVTTNQMESNAVASNPYVVYRQFVEEKLFARFSKQANNAQARKKADLEKAAQKLEEEARKREEVRIKEEMRKNNIPEKAPVAPAGPIMELKDFEGNTLMWNTNSNDFLYPTTWGPQTIGRVRNTSRQSPQTMNSQTMQEGGKKKTGKKVTKK